MTERTPAETIDRVRNLLAFMLVGSFVGALIDFTLFAVPPSNKDIITYMVGQLSGMALMALGMYFTKNAGQDMIDATRASNTAKAFEAITATATAPAKPDVILAPGETAQASEEPTS